MGFMKPQVTHISVYVVETTHGTELVPTDLCGSTTADMSPYVEGEPLEGCDIEVKSGWFGRLSAPGYLDCTTWDGPYDTAKKAFDALTDMYGDDQEDLPEDEMYDDLEKECWNTV